MSHTAFRLAALATICTVAGCAQETSVSGTVTFNGQPIERGSIRFVSTEKQGPTFGAVIKDGKYTVEKAVPGSKVATIQAMNEARCPPAPPSWSKWPSRHRRAESRSSDATDPLALIPPDAEGNSQTVEITEGPQTLDFHLKSPER